MNRTTISLFLVLLFTFTPAYPNAIDFKAMSLEVLQTYETDALTKKERKAHKKALKKAEKAARREARKNAPRPPYCNKLAKASGRC